MNATQPNTRKTDLTVIHVLAQLLERMERSAMPVGAEQYRLVVVRRLVSELGDVGPETALHASGASKQQAKEVLDRAMRRAMDRSNTPKKEDSTHGKS